MWLLRVQACFRAHDTAPTKMGHWMVTALQGEAARFWHVQCEALGVQPDPTRIAEKLKDRFRPPSFHHDLMARMTSLRMQSGQFPAYADQFMHLYLQIPNLSDVTAQSLFLNGLTQTYRLHVDLHGTTDFQDALATARRIDASFRASHTNAGTSTFGAGAVRSYYPNRGRGTHAQPFRGRGRRSFGQRGASSSGFRSSSMSRNRSMTPMGNRNRSFSRTSSRGQGSQPATPRVRIQERQPGACFNCGHAGHMQRECPVPRQRAPNTQPHNRGQGRGTYPARGSGRGRPQGNAPR